MRLAKCAQLDAPMPYSIVKTAAAGRLAALKDRS